MYVHKFLRFCTFLLAIASLTTCKSIQAQVIPDSTLGSESSRIQPDLSAPSVNVIEGGAKREGNLFHSFKQFTIPSGSTAYFNNTTDIQNIISRVTGSSVSSIDGLIKANGNANLFLLNPNGIVFGSNARLNIGGSFLASTASSINFTNGIQFNASNPSSTPLLTINVPIGLAFPIVSPQPITVEGGGHSLLFDASSAGNPIIGTGQTLVGLRTQPEQSIALVGGDINFEGGILTTPSGRIEIGSVNSGSVGIELTNGNILLSYDDVKSFRDINLEKLALLDASGINKGYISLVGKNITITDPSLIIISNFRNLPSGEISVNASERLEVNGIRTLTKPTPQEVGPARGIVTETLSTGKAADIKVFANNILVKNFGSISSTTFNSGAGGNISLTAKEAIKLFSSNLPTKALLVGYIATFSYGQGDAGELGLLTKDLSITDGSFVASQVFSSGNGGRVIVNATDSIKISGGTEIGFDDNFINNSFWASFLESSTNSSGKAGDVFITTANLKLDNGARLASYTLASGSAGNLIVNARESVFVTGKNPISLTPTFIVSSANVAEPYFRFLFRLPKSLDGKSGAIDINTARLNVQDGAQISVKNDGINDGGALAINASSINLDQGSITAATASGEGGEIFLRSRFLQLGRDSSITATAGNNGNGGNINIDTDLPD